jgi:hypothetical protein
MRKSELLLVAQRRQPRSEFTRRKVLDHVAAALRNKRNRVRLGVKVFERRAQQRIGELREIRHLR